MVHATTTLKIADYKALRQNPLGGFSTASLGFSHAKRSHQEVL